MNEIEIEQAVCYRAGNLALEENAVGYRLSVGGDTVTLTADDLATLCALVNRAAAIDAAADARAATDAGNVEDRPAAVGPVSRRGIKAWAREQGWWVSERGRVTDAVIAAFDAAHGISA